MLPLFHCVTLGLDEAILGFSAGGDPEEDAGRIASLLANGAHCLVNDVTEAAVAFAAEGIDQVCRGGVSVPLSVCMCHAFCSDVVHRLHDASVGSLPVAL